MPIRSFTLALVAAGISFGISISPAAAQSAEYKVVEAGDIAIGPRKYFDRDIEIRNLKCMYADASDYRCITGQGVTIFAASVQPVEMDSWIKENCESLRSVATSSKCNFNIRFKFTAKQIDKDIISGYQSRTTISPDQITLFRTSRKR